MKKKITYSKINRSEIDQTSKIYLTICPSLIQKLLINKIFNSVNLQKYNGIYIATENRSVSIENNLKDIKDISFISYYIVSLAYRFKRSKLNKVCSIYYTLPFSYNLDLNLRYIICTIEHIVKKYHLNKQNVEIYLNKFDDKYINIFLKRYYKKKYNIKIKFVCLGKIIRPTKQMHFCFNSSNPISLFSILKSIPFKTINCSNKFVKTKILELSSFVKLKKPYQINKKESFLQNSLNSLDFNDLFKYGLNKYKSISYILFKSLISIKYLKLNDIYRIIKYNLFLDYIQININRLFIKNITIFLNKINIEYLFCSHRSFTYESLLYKACRLSGVKSIATDFSLGSPLKNIYKKDFTLTTRPDILLVNSLFRKEQYLIANKAYINSGNNLQVINCNCMQVEYARRNSKNLKNIKKSNQSIVISIFDNNYSENLGIRAKYTKDLGQCLYKYKENLYCLVHSKVKLLNLDNELLNNKINFSKGIKGDFSLDVNSDLIVSIGFQGAAIKSAFAFKKPIIFFSSDKDYFKNVVFFEDKELNQKVMDEFKNLIFGNSELELLLADPINREKSLIRLLKITNNFLGLIGITDENINVTNYLKDL